MSRNPSGGELGQRELQAEVTVYGKALNRKRAGIFENLSRIQHDWIIVNKTKKSWVQIMLGLVGHVKVLEIYP